MRTTTMKASGTGTSPSLMLVWEEIICTDIVWASMLHTLSLTLLVRLSHSCWKVIGAECNPNGSQWNYIFHALRVATRGFLDQWYYSARIHRNETCSKYFAYWKLNELLAIISYITRVQPNGSRYVPVDNSDWIYFVLCYVVDHIIIKLSMFETEFLMIQLKNCEEWTSTLGQTN